MTLCARAREHTVKEKRKGNVAVEQWVTSKSIAGWPISLGITLRVLVSHAHTRGSATATKKKRKISCLCPSRRYTFTMTKSLSRYPRTCPSFIDEGKWRSSLSGGIADRWITLDVISSFQSSIASRGIVTLFNNGAFSESGRNASCALAWGKKMRGRDQRRGLLSCAFLLYTLRICVYLYISRIAITSRANCNNLYESEFNCRACQRVLRGNVAFGYFPATKPSWEIVRTGRKMLQLLSRSKMKRMALSFRPRREKAAE